MHLNPLHIIIAFHSIDLECALQLFIRFFIKDYVLYEFSFESFHLIHGFYEHVRVSSVGDACCFLIQVNFNLNDSLLGFKGLLNRLSTLITIVHFSEFDIQLLSLIA
jgi:hypothetical protein